MTARFATPDEIQNWNDLIVANPDGGNIFASYEFALQKETGGYTAMFLVVDSLAVTVLQKSAGILGKIWYLPKGPELLDISALLTVADSIRTFAAKHGVFALKIESELDKTVATKLTEKGFIESIPIIPNPSTITLDISPNLDTLLTSLPQKGRYAIKRAARDGVTTQQVRATDENCKIMFDLLAETAKGQFGIRSFDYYRTFWQRFEAAGSGQLFFASFDDKIVAGAYAMVLGAKSTYKDGASVRERTTYGASHLLQWSVIEWAKSKGSLLHDFCGSPPSDQVNNPDHKHHGIGLFKTAFSKHIVDYIGCYDVVIQPIRYRIWSKLGERIARRIHFYKQHDSYW